MAVLVGRKAPHFKAKAIVNGGEEKSDFSLDQYLGKKKVIFFFYPKDFTFVCPTELHAFQENLTEFEKRNTAVVACSTDTEKSHWGWLQMENLMVVSKVLLILLLPILTKQFQRILMFSKEIILLTKMIN